MEALLRWQRPGSGLVPPDQFVPLAEDTGFIVPLGEWVLTRALRQLAEWTADGVVHSELTVAVNLSARQLLDRALPDVVARLLTETRVAPERLHLEITESVWMSERPTVNEVVQRLARSGVTLVIDDFGTGYSSLAYLRELPARQLKIDRRFVRRLEGDSRDRSLVAAVAGLAREFGLQTVAEGVETQGQRPGRRPRLRPRAGLPVRAARRAGGDRRLAEGPERVTESAPGSRGAHPPRG